LYALSAASFVATFPVEQLPIRNTKKTAIIEIESDLKNTLDMVIPSFQGYILCRFSMLDRNSICNPEKNAYKNCIIIVTAVLLQVS
jgi:hypothetical protein